MDATAALAAPAVPGPALSGLHVPLVTPFTAQGDLAADALEGLAHQVLDDGADGLVALGTTGEPGVLEDEERRAVVDVCVRVCRERGASLVVGAGSSSTRASVRELAALGGRPEIGAALVTVPSFVRPSEAGVLAHFGALAAHSPVPLVVYNIPYRTGQRIGADTLRELAALPNIAGVKHAVGGIDADTVNLLADPPPASHGFAVLGGDDAYLPPLLALGGQGGILASAHLCTARWAELVAAWRDGDVARARELGRGAVRLASAVFTEPNPTVVKGVLHAQGRIPSPDVRLPLLSASAAAVDAALYRATEWAEASAPALAAV
ncbi:4-hydroxy-tetrahydrodipicolinate synthase [Streptomyces sp. RKND-216]|uniref:dihydrodipicolinate synthase family protein n=1 Tax=Streptomyces sp. RKND-216 TaxID=2562581 RepID=UPI00109D929C|nr:dihydrodipicolinate synthase family protein [Streptomyces sp. RKND-216]THA25844.1 4-hydroxy-tetrahydrodipicolinate synthase [Streptomyces sp. RKND-216]